MTDKQKPGYVFLTEIGKKRLRPGGIVATNWLFERGKFSKDKKILEVACHQGDTVMEIAEKFGSQVIGIDLDSEAIKRANFAINEKNLTNLASTQVANALDLPFPDNYFDCIINEAMLTMLDEDEKQQALAEYYRVLKSGGKLLTQDVCFKVKNEQTKNKLRQTVNMPISPLSIGEWRALFAKTAFKHEFQVGKCSLLSFSGLLRDEGISGTVRILKNGLKKENRAQLLKMIRFFQRQNNVCYIVNHMEK
ncbi:hypothetical protein Hs30E_06800 [Lactococcus hodotermopsidis]|uniref:Methyltransferase domain-containing protein n=1 Tax=Pseudolactococcus hodotermopsidis TaxID=2709157 RepID=A0A6A0B9K8_9LACT|nr:class I SAM-dependent methyltransferase [Lactococcus hodotermopsidis]GFH42129.1 hypothetical protein Hs30E_06800 [Lactococcus hodotermopsidis]